jgi:hypothetical protein
LAVAGGRRRRLAGQAPSNAGQPIGRNNPIVHAEMAFACETIESVDDLLLPANLCASRPIPLAAAFVATRSHSATARGAG